jgi:hypothetical protein
MIMKTAKGAEVLCHDNNHNIAKKEESQRNQSPPRNNCARGIDQGRNRVSPRRKPDDLYFCLINTAFQN